MPALCVVLALTPFVLSSSFLRVGYEYRTAADCDGHVNKNLEAIYHARGRSWNRYGPGDDELSENYMEVDFFLSLS